MKSNFNIILTMAPCQRLSFNISDIYPLPRLGIGYISSFLKYNGFSSTYIIDPIFRHQYSLFIKKLKSLDAPPNLIGISTTILSLKEAEVMAKLIKKDFPDTYIVAGGPGISFSKEILFEYLEHVDFFIRGEGEIPFLKLASVLKNNSDIFSVPSLIFKKNYVIYENKSHPGIDLNNFVFPDYDAFDTGKYELHPPMGIYRPSTIVETIRGCSYSCQFCCLHSSVKLKSPENVEKEIKWLIEKYGIKEIHFVDPTFTLYNNRTIEIIDRIKNLNIAWSCKTRTDHVNFNLIEKMSKAGCYLISFGVESLLDSFLSEFNKENYSDSAYDVFKICKQNNVRTAAYMLIGVENENDDSIRYTHNNILKLDPDYVLYSTVMPDPLNELTKKLIKKNAFTEKDVVKYYMTREENYFTKYNIYGHPTKQIKKWLIYLSSKFYLRPAYFYKRLTNLRSINELKNLFVGGTVFIKDKLKFN